MKVINPAKSDLGHRTGKAGQVHRHKLPVCQATGLARYRDRHQARHGAEAMLAGAQTFEVHTFACPDCRGWHLERSYRREPITLGAGTEAVKAFTETLAARKRRYFLVDIENPTRGAKVTSTEVAEFWNILKQHAPGVAPHDHVVVGAGRMVARKYRAAIHGANVRWVVGADGANGADRALLAAIDLQAVTRDYDELVIVSGDHAFADLARRARASGLSVQVVTAEHPERRRTLSRELAAAANTHTMVRLQARTPKQNQATPSTLAARINRQLCEIPAAA